MGASVSEQVVRWPVLLQGWVTMTFLHWRYDPAAVRPLVPAELELDLFDGAAWVSIAAFEMVGVRLPGLPPVPRLSRFPETNLRTYMRGPDGRDGVWFFSLDAASLATVVGGRRLYGVPYHRARMSVDVGGTVRYRSRRCGAAVGYDITVRQGTPYDAAEVTELDHYLTRRWRGYGQLAGRLAVAEVSHPPWPLYRATVTELHQTLTVAAGLPTPAEAPLVHYSPGVEARLAAPRLA